jgi:hypothetical protein
LRNFLAALSRMSWMKVFGMDDSFLI